MSAQGLYIFWMMAETLTDPVITTDPRDPLIQADGITVLTNEPARIMYIIDLDMFAISIKNIPDEPPAPISILDAVNFWLDNARPKNKAKFLELSVHVQDP